MTSTAAAGGRERTHVFLQLVLPLLPGGEGRGGQVADGHAAAHALGHQEQHVAAALAQLRSELLVLVHG